MDITPEQLPKPQNLVKPFELRLIALGKIFLIASGCIIGFGFAMNVFENLHMQNFSMSFWTFAEMTLAVGFFMIPIGTLLWVMGSSIKKVKEWKNHEVSEVNVKPIPTRLSLISWNIAALMVMVGAGGLSFLMLAFSTDDPRSAGIAPFIFMCLILVYFVGGFVSLILSQIRRSVLLTTWQLFTPFIFFGIIFLYIILQSEWYIVTSALSHQ